MSDTKLGTEMTLTIQSLIKHTDKLRGLLGDAEHRIAALEAEREKLRATLEKIAQYGWNYDPAIAAELRRIAREALIEAAP